MVCGAASRPSILAVPALMTNSSFCCLHERQVRGLRALEDAAGVIVSQQHAPTGH